MPNEQGRFCNACTKTVVDFSLMNDDQVEQYFITNYEKQVCGRFKNTQLQRITIILPRNIFRLRLPFWKKFLVAFLIVYGASFLSIDTAIAGNTYIQGEPVALHSSNTAALKLDKKHPRNAKKKRKRKYRIAYTGDWLISGNISCMPIETTLGMTVSPDPKNIPIDYVNFPYGKTYPNEDSTVNNNTVPDDRRKEPQPVPVPLGSEFILPAVLALRRSVFSKMKD